MSETVTENGAPLVLISYSHDTPDHKRWVSNLASRLLNDGIDVILDQWETGLGDDLPKFMERAVSRSDRVVMICTEAYVRKADDGKGGVGYEAMIVTGELVRDLDSRKFIPLIRQPTGEAKKPKFLETRYHVNFSNDAEFETAYEELLRELHNAPKHPKPKLGKNPFSAEAERMSKVGADPHFSLALRLSSEFPNDALEVYHAGIECARRSDRLAWRKLTQRTLAKLPEMLGIWRNKYDKNPPDSVEALPQMTLDGVSACAPIIAIALAGLESQDPHFSNQIGLIDDFLFPRNWERSGSTVVVQLPTAIVFTYQAVFGSLAIQTGQVEIANRLATTRIQDLASSRDSEMLFLQTEFTGWPDSLNHTVTIAWKFLTQLPESWPWLTEVFGDIESFRASLCAYYMFLNTLEFLDAVRKACDLTVPQNVRLTVPVCFCVMSEQVRKKAIRYFRENLRFLADLWSDTAKSYGDMSDKWQLWLAVIDRWVQEVYRDRFWIAGAPHAELPQMISEL